MVNAKIPELLKIAFVNILKKGHSSSVHVFLPEFIS
jgi:hypothetical protein